MLRPLTRGLVQQPSRVVRLLAPVCTLLQPLLLRRLTALRHEGIPVLDEVSHVTMWRHREPVEVLPLALQPQRGSRRALPLTARGPSPIPGRSWLTFCTRAIFTPFFLPQPQSQRWPLASKCRRHPSLRAKQARSAQAARARAAELAQREGRRRVCVPSGFLTHFPLRTRVRLSWVVESSMRFSCGCRACACASGQAGARELTDARHCNEFAGSWFTEF